MHGPTRGLILELLTWVSARPRTYAEAMDAWRSTCPRHPIWDDALIDGLVQVERGSATRESMVTLTPRGQALLDAESPPRSEVRVIQRPSVAGTEQAVPDQAALLLSNSRAD